MKPQTDLLIVGGGLGGCAAAMAATALGKRVILTEETDWLGGQATSQITPPDEHPWIDWTGASARYRRYRELVCDYYRTHYDLQPGLKRERLFNPGGGSVSCLCHEPRVSVAVLEAMLAAAYSGSLLDIKYRCRPISAQTDGDRVSAIRFEQLDTGETFTLSAHYVLDATELGDLLPLTGAEYVCGAESQAETGEPHAVDGPAQPANQQAFTWCFAMAYDPGSHRVIDQPAEYTRWRDYVPPLTPPWSGPLLSWRYCHPHDLRPIDRWLFDQRADQGPLWHYRQIITPDHFRDPTGIHPVTIVNWPMNDYLEGNLIDVEPTERARAEREARELSLSLFYWMQTEAPRPDGGTGYPGLYLRPDITGTPDGLAKAPYIRESRRIRARFTMPEQRVASANAEQSPMRGVADSVGTGSYRIDLHPSTGGDNYIDVGAIPFELPLGMLIPVRLENLLPANKNIGTTHISNGCYRLHPVEWSAGEAAGLLAAWCLDQRLTPAAVHENHTHQADFLHLCDAQGLCRHWPDYHAR